MVTIELIEVKTNRSTIIRYNRVKLTVEETYYRR